jgi:hypothetical protein
MIMDVQPIKVAAGDVGQRGAQVSWSKPRA